MSVSEAKLRANRENAQKSTGPKSLPGKGTVAGNARRHGLAASAEAEEAMPGFAARLAQWDADIRPASAEARQALRQVVAATFRLERCQAAYASAVAEHSARARDAWDDDRLADAAALLGALAKRPEVVAPKLRTSAAGASLMLRVWERLAESLDAHAGEWSDDELSTVCDLLGLPTHLRSGWLPFDPADASTGRLESRRAFVARETESLRETSRGRLARVDRLERSHAESGASSMQAKSVRLILRYEAAARRWYDESLKAAKSCTSPLPDVVSDGSLPFPWMNAIRRLKAKAAVPKPPEVPKVDEAAPLREPGDAVSIEADDLEDDGPEIEVDDEAELVGAGAPSPSRSSGTPLNRHQRRRREALARRDG